MQISARQRADARPRAAATGGDGFGRLPGAGLLALLLVGCGGGGGGGGGSIPGVVEVVSEAPTLAPVAALEGVPGERRTVDFVVRFSQNLSISTILSYQTFGLRSGLGFANEGGSCADAGVDFLRAAGDIKIVAETRSVTIPVQLCGDAEFEPHEQLGLRFSWNGFSVSAVGTVVNDDAGGLNDSGTKSCANGSAHGVCPQVGFSLQDGDFGRDSQVLTQSGAGLKGFAFEKLDAAGVALAGASASWACVRDRVTGLVWDSGNAATGPAPSTWGAAVGHASALNTERRCGFADWRVPEPRELLSLVDSGRSSGVLVDTLLFPSQRPQAYWSRAAFAGDGAAAWVVDFGSGASSFLNQARADVSYRAVRGETDATRAASDVCLAAPVANDPYQDNSDGTVTDPATGLMWMQCSEGLSGAGCASGAALALNWQQALARAATVNASAVTLGRSYGDWRVPNRNELASLVKPLCVNPSINRRRFPNTQADNYWSSTPWAPDAGRAWYVNFVEGNLAPGLATELKPVRLVRAGQ